MLVLRTFVLATVVLFSATGCERAPVVPAKPLPPVTAGPVKPPAMEQSPEGSPATDSDFLQGHEDLDATVWMRTSAEYRILAVDTYQRALAAVKEGMADPKWSALPAQSDQLQAQTDSGETLEPAVILDVDETVLDNSQYQVECISGEPFQFSGEQWTAWCLRSDAVPVPGVVDFIQGCRDRGVAIRYVTNRDSEVRAATLENLRKFGLVPDADSAGQELLCKKDRPEWGSDKTTRREFVASQFRVLALVGDDLNDFIFTGDKATPDERTAAAMAYHANWGTRWFLLPNANYGGWEKSVQQYRFPAERKDFLKLKLESLKTTSPNDPSTFP